MADDRDFGTDEFVTIDGQRPNSARMYDYLLGGASNFAVDREAARQAAAVFPHFRIAVRVNREFLGRAVTYLVRQGIDQFLDLGSGIPTVGNVHEVARRHNPTARVAYVDNEPVAVTHARTLLRDDAYSAVADVDIRDPARVLASPQVAELLDFSRPVAVLAVAILHFLPDDQDPSGMLAAYRDACPAGSYLALSHGAQVTLTDQQIADFQAAYARTPTPAVFRTETEIAGFFAGYEPVDPGVTLLPRWHPEQPVSERDAREANLYGGVGILRG
ncbi:SAM-dependent methyltransferase [Rugosimonospora africana]|uniref:S-adenosyl methyltransferase n=1 Tax=Rugosimonospora africana TaxID=556532 RepID=A0A8J3QT05_9ACTN|nr:SAM-dependent methyltransferase [Rugosimonospora africana]GIH15098.1 hypothetical protein Raf01_32700 [Rugosimonospora africana]